MTNDRESMVAAQEVCADKSWISSWAVPSLDPLACVAYYSEQHAPGDIAYFQTGSIFSDLRLTSMLLRQHAVRDAEVSLYLDVPAGLAPIVLAATVPKRLTQAGLRMPLDRRLGVLLEHLKELGVRPRIGWPIPAHPAGAEPGPEAEAVVIGQKGAELATRTG